MDTHLTIPLPVEPLDIVPLVGNQLNDAACIIGYIKKDIIGARESCDTAARLCPSFASYLEIITPEAADAPDRSLKLGCFG